MFAEYLSGPRSPSVWQESIAQDLQNIMNMQQMLDEKTFEQAIDVIEKGKTLYLSAIEASEVAVRLLGFYFRVVLKKAYIPLLGHGLSMQMKVSDIGPEDVFIGVSYQRIFQEIRDAAVFAKGKGAYTVAITDSMANALANVCDYVLIAPVTGATFGYSHTAPVAMVNMIVNSLAARNPEKSLSALEDIRNFWNTTDVFCS